MTVQQANVNRPRRWQPCPHTLTELVLSVNPHPYRGRTGPGTR